MIDRRGRREERLGRFLSPPATRLWLFAAAAAIVPVLVGFGSSAVRVASWPLPNLNLSSTRALESSGITAKNIAGLHVAWKFRLKIPPGFSGADTATPVVAGGVVYLQDMNSNVYALDLKTGALRWRAPVRRPESRPRRSDGGR